MDLIERLRRRYFERQFGPERAALIRRVEAQVRALPFEVLTEAWVRWLWRQPPEDWERLIEDRRDWTPPVPRPSLTPQEVEARFEPAKVRTEEIATAFETSLRGLSFPSWEADFAEARSKVRSTAALDPRLTAWLDALPLDAQEGGAEICGLLMTLDQIHAARSRAEERGIGEEQRAALESWAQRCEEDYREVAEPFFTIYGAPDPQSEGWRARNEPPRSD